MNARQFRLILVFAPAIALWFAGGLLTSGEPEPKAADYAGKVVSLADVLDKQGVKLDRDAMPFALALVTVDGRTFPLVKDAGSRMFFKDKALLNRSMRLAGRLVGDGKMLQVLSVRSVVDGRLHEPYYWCDICKIKRFEPNDCDCCGAPLEFREEPVAR